jgi:hypothetical protein
VFTARYGPGLYIIVLSGVIKRLMAGFADGVVSEHKRNAVAVYCILCYDTLYEQY